MLGLDNATHIALVLLVVLLVFGAKRLPEVGRSLGAGLRGFKESIEGEPAHPEELPAARAPIVEMTAAQGTATGAPPPAAPDPHQRALRLSASATGSPRDRGTTAP